MGVGLARLSLALLGPLLAVTAQAHCGHAVQRAQRVESPRYQLAFATHPSPLPLGRHFTMEVFVCPKPGQAAAEGLSIQATMPTHGHGMNYQPQVRQLAPGHYHIEGMMFHMRGPWTISFQVGAAGRSDLVEHHIDLK